MKKLNITSVSSLKDMLTDEIKKKSIGEGSNGTNYSEQMYVEHHYNYVTHKYANTRIAA